MTDLHDVALPTPTQPTATPLTGALGAEVTGVDLCELDESEWDAVRALLLEHLVLFFPGQSLTEEAHVALGRRMGEVEIHPFLPKVSDDYPEIAQIDSDRGPAEGWHTDVTFSPTPPMASILRMRDCPPVGGDTAWTNQYQAYEMLSEPLRSFVDGLSAWHSAAPLGHPELGAEHPVVRIHPETGRRSLYVNRSFTSHILQLRREESDALLQMLLAWSEQLRFQCRYRWSPGAVAIWDNRCTQHHPVYDYDEFRRINRVTIIGDVPVGPGVAWPRFQAVGRARTRSDMLYASGEADPRANSVRVGDGAT